MFDNEEKTKQINRIATPIKLDENGNKIIDKTNLKSNVIKNENNSRIMFIITTILIIFAIICFILFYFIIPELMKKDNELKYNDVTTKTTKYINKYFSTSSINGNQVINDAGVFLVNNNYLISTVNNGLSLDILVNNIKICEAENLLPTIGHVDDLIIFITQNNEDRTTKLYSVDKDGKIILELYNINSIDGLVLNSSNVIYDTVSLVFSASRVVGTNLVLDNGFGLTYGVNICSNEDLVSKKIDNNFLVKGVFSIEYLGNHLFSEPTILYSTDLGEYKSNYNLCN